MFGKGCPSRDIQAQLALGWWLDFGTFFGEPLRQTSRERKYSLMDTKDNGNGNAGGSGGTSAPRDVSMRCRIVFCMPPLPDAASLLDDALGGGDVASVMLLRGELDDVAYQDHCARLVPIAQGHDVAALVCDDTRALGRVNADGIFLSSGGNDPVELIARFSTQKIVGCGGIKDRHRALEIGDANPHFVFFGKPDGDIRPQAHPKNLALAEWWSQMIEIPCVVMGGSSLETLVECAASGAEFVGLGLAVFSHTDGPGAAIREANRLLYEHAPIFADAE